MKALGRALALAGVVAPCADGAHAQTSLDGSLIEFSLECSADRFTGAFKSKIRVLRGEVLSYAQGYDRFPLRAALGMGEQETTEAGSPFSPYKSAASFEKGQLRVSVAYTRSDTLDDGRHRTVVYSRGLVFALSESGKCTPVVFRFTQQLTLDGTVTKSDCGPAVTGTCTWTRN
jgi:hypothetical protein